VTATPGLAEAGHDFYAVEGAFATRDVLANFEGGRVIIGALSTPFKCPPASSETALMLHDYLVERGTAWDDLLGATPMAITMGSFPLDMFTRHLTR
jgi:hypothetical protein